MLNILSPTNLPSHLQHVVKQISFSKHYHLHRENTVCNHLYCIEKGIVRSYYHKDGKDITAHFATEGEIITAIDSFIQRKRSRYNLELLEDATLTAITHQDLTMLLDNYPQYEHEARLFLERVYIDLAERVEDLLFYDARERYEKLTEKNSSLLQRVSLKHIASYLGITQETLSRIRAKTL